ncbi:MFS transporter [Nonomuraea insulae]|uniref:MFS transporter n=1 Tax=Nonomuraea insulae TaxID=1616787 RepID=A0ABW1D9W6_9ACTN
MAKLTSEQQLKQTRRSALGGFLGTALEYLDFTMYGIVASVVLGRVFFPGADTFAAQAGAMATFGAAYIARPIGALILGHLGDRVGRQKILLFTIVLMGTATFLIGCLPSYQSIGTFAPIALVVLRLAQGFSAAGEQAGSSTLTMEHAPPRKRTFYVSFTNAGTILGNLLGQVAFIPVLALPEQDLLAWGWRLPFLISAVGMAIVIYIRRGLHDAEVFEAVKGEKRRSMPLPELFRGNWKNLIRVVLCCLMAAPASIAGVFGLSYSTQVIGLDAGVLVALGTISQAIGLVSIPLWGLLADRIGRRPVFIGGVLIAGVMLFVKFHFAVEKNLFMLTVAQCLFTIFLMAGQAMQLSIYTEMFETKVRFSGVAVGTQFGYLLAGFAPTLSYAILQPGPTGWLPVAIFGALCCLVASAAAFSARETRGASLERLEREVMEQTSASDAKT